MENRNLPAVALPPKSALDTSFSISSRLAPSDRTAPTPVGTNSKCAARNLDILLLIRPRLPRAITAPCGPSADNTSILPADAIFDVHDEHNCRAVPDHAPRLSEPNTPLRRGTLYHDRFKRATPPPCPQEAEPESSWTSCGTAHLPEGIPGRGDSCAGEGGW